MRSLDYLHSIVPTVVKPATQAAVMPISLMQTAPLETRIRAYMRHPDFAISGQHGHDRALWAARCLVTGFLLSEEAAFGYLAEWNLGCVPPWSE